ncbi:hypothetical protein ACVNF4_06010 [Streptomyces sp. S6]
MAWDERGQRKAAASERQDGSGGLDLGMDPDGRQVTMPGAYGVPRVPQKDLTAIGACVHTLSNDLYALPLRRPRGDAS